MRKCFLIVSAVEMNVYDNYKWPSFLMCLVETTGSGSPMVYIMEMEYLFS